MRTFCLTCPEQPTRRTDAERHFLARGLEVDFVWGYHAETFGILCSKPVNNMGDLVRTPMVGLTLSHYMVWNICLHVPGDSFLILEDDAKFEYEWKTRFDQTLIDLPEDWDICLIGSSHTTDKPRRHITGEVYEVTYPFCTHAYMVKKKALPVLLETCRKANQHIDTLMILCAYPHLRVFTVLPRIVDQRGTFLPP